jgi:gas vesicle protein
MKAEQLDSSKKQKEKNYLINKHYISINYLTIMPQTKATITVKIYFRPGNIVKRTKIHASTTLEQFFEIARRIHEQSHSIVPSFLNQDYVLTYQDEDMDWVTIGSEEEWQYALIDEFRRAANADSYTMKINLRNKLYLPSIEGPEYLNKFINKANQLAEQLQNEIASDKHIKRGKQLLKDAKNDLTNAWNELLDGLLKLISSKVQQKQEEVQTESNNIESSSVHIQTEEEQMQEYEEGYESDFSEESEEDETVIHNPLHEFEEESNIVMEEGAPSIESDYKYLEGLETLCSMGFTDIEHNKQLLDKYEGDLTKVIADIFN